MREITSHVVNPANDRLKIEVIDEPSHGGACHAYRITIPASGDMEKAVFLDFQNGPIDTDGNGVNGLTHEALIAILIDRLQGFQAGKYACRENALALTKLEEAAHWLAHRTRARMARSVEGSHTV
jgi:hypothetical protein